MATVGGIDVGRRRDRTVRLGLRGPVDDTGRWEIDDLVVPVLDSIPRQARDARPWVFRRDLTAIDCTGLGMGVADLLVEAHPVRVFPATIVGGDQLDVRVRPPVPGYASGGVESATVGKLWLMRRLAQAVRRGEFVIPPTLPHREGLKVELAGLRGRYTRTGRIMVDAGTGHDDMALALALALLAKDLRGIFDGPRRHRPGPRADDHGDGRGAAAALGRGAPARGPLR